MSDIFDALKKIGTHSALGYTGIFSLKTGAFTKQPTLFFKILEKDKFDLDIFYNTLNDIGLSVSYDFLKNKLGKKSKIKFVAGVGTSLNIDNLNNLELKGMIGFKIGL